LNFKYNRSTFVVCSSTTVLLTIVFLSKDIVSIVEGCIPIPPTTTTAPRGLFKLKSQSTRKRIKRERLKISVCCPMITTGNPAQAASTSNRSWLRRVISTTSLFEKSLSTIRSTGLFQESRDNGAPCLSHYFILHHLSECFAILLTSNCHLFQVISGTTPVVSSSTELTVAMLAIECVAPERWMYRNTQQKVFEFTGVSCNQETPTFGSYVIS
uniref:Secreted protein n=1 Tax=Brugia timori TaxID=42155 RepID=A0A0R3QJT5_9BILA